MDFIAIEKKWHEYWKANKTNKFDEKKLDKKYYLLEMFSYPSGAKLHLGHWWNYGLSDSFGRFKKMKGFNVFQPMGFDAFGLPAENYAIKTGIHPKDSTDKNIAVMEEQLQKMDGLIDWDYEIKTCEPDYYKWSQWLFLELYKNGLAYQKYAPVNWCPSCNTVLANEQVIDGECERCGSVVEHKNLTQWFFKITDYAERLLDDHKKLDWPNKTIVAQKNWIDKSIGGEVAFKLENSDQVIKTFTTRADTLFGVTYIVLAPEHPLVDTVTTPEHKDEVEQYISNAKKKSEIDRTSTATEKTGAFTGSFVINPINNEKVPVLIGDYVIGSYGTGAVMGVAAHDTRDYDFAKKYNLPIVRVLNGVEGKDELPFTEYGTLTNSGEFDGLDSKTAINKILEKLEQMGAGNKKVNYRLRDWSVSRQRYWGCPIPIIHCDDCGAVPVPEKDLPVQLPYEIDWKPKGTSPLCSNEEYMNTVCPKCGKPARRDPDTLDTFVCSSWYFLRYPNVHNSEKPFDTDFTNKILPVNKYVGGMEHACGHLLYSRFITKFLYDKGYINFDEPFTSLIHQGIILGEDGQKMSKSRGNTVSPDELIEKYGSDILRLYLMFGFNYMEGGPWSNDGIASIAKFAERLERIITKCAGLQEENANLHDKNEKDLEYTLHYTMKCLNNDFEIFSFNTAVARVMELVNAMYKYDALEVKNTKLLKDCAYNLTLLIAPMVPHIAEELFDLFKTHNGNSIFEESYPTPDPNKLVKDEVEIAVQINNKIITKMEIPTNAENDEIEKLVLSDAKVSEMMANKTIVKVVIVKGRLVNIIAK